MWCWGMYTSTLWHNFPMETVNHQVRRRVSMVYTGSFFVYREELIVVVTSPILHGRDGSLTPANCRKDAEIAKSIFGKDAKQRSKPLWKLIQDLKQSFSDQQLGIVHFWVVKVAKGYKKGDKILNKREAERVLKSGGKLRDIYTFTKPVRDKLKRIAEVLDLKCEWQHGFHKERGVHTAWTEIKQQGGYFLLVDLKNAFCQISRGQLYGVLRRVFDLNKADSLWFSKVMCDNQGMMFQGNPITPAIFNILSARIGKILHKNTEYTLIQYADDLTICSKTPLSHKDIGFVKKLISYTGWEVNREKVHYIRRKRRFSTLGITQEKDGKIHANGTSKLKKVVRWLNHIRQKEKDNTSNKEAEALSNKTAKDGTRIMLKSVVSGIKAWLNGVYEIELGKFRDRKICQTNLANLSDKSLRATQDPLPLILQYEMGILTKSTK